MKKITLAWIWTIMIITFSFMFPKEFQFNEIEMRLFWVLTLIVHTTVLYNIYTVGDEK